MAETPPTQVVTLTPVEGGELAAGTYRYRIVFVDADGNEGPPSGATSAATIDDTTENRAIRLDNLPAASEGFVGRRIYRSATGPNGPFVLAAEINAASTTFTDLGADWFCSIVTTTTPPGCSSMSGSGSLAARGSCSRPPGLTSTIPPTTTAPRS